MPTPVVELASLPEPQVIEEIDFEAIVTLMRNDMVARFPAIIGVIDLESEPARKLIEIEAFREVVLRARINDAARANLLAFATGSDLDHLGASSSPPTSRMTGEDDERYRLRIQLGAQSRNTGSEARYRRAALDASTLVKDAIAYREGRSPTVKVAILSTAQDGVANQALIDLVSGELALPENRLVNTPFEVRSAVTSVTNVVASLVTQPGQPSSITAIAEANLRTAFAAEGGLGRDLTRDWIKSRLMVPGVYAVTLSTPASDVIVPPYEATAIGTVALTISGTNA